MVVGEPTVCMFNIDILDNTHAAERKDMWMQSSLIAYCKL